MTVSVQQMTEHVGIQNVDEETVARVSTYVETTYPRRGFLMVIAR